MFCNLELILTLLGSGKLDADVVSAEESRVDGSTASKFARFGYFAPQ